MNKFSLVLAVDHNGTMGMDGHLPWPKVIRDIKHFVDITKNKAVLMGRKTLVSMGGPLTSRLNIVASRNFEKVRYKNFVGISTLDIPPQLHIPNERIYVIGGKTLYEHYYDIADEIYLSIINGTYYGDTHFNVNISDWNIVDEEKWKDESGVTGKFLRLIK